MISLRGRFFDGIEKNEELVFQLNRQYGEGCKLVVV